MNFFKKEMRYAVFKQKHFYYKFNLQSVNSPFWFGSRICICNDLKSPQWLRELKFKKRPFWRIDKKRLNNILPNGGWHFCNLKTLDKLKYKYENLCETDDPIVFNEKIDQKYLTEKNIQNNIENRKDIIGRNDEFIKINIDKSFPKYLIQNLEKYKKDWIV